MAQWALVFASLLVGGALAGWLLRVGPGTGIFVAGAIPILWSLTDIRTGGPKTRIARAIDGKPVWGVDHHLRSQEIKRGLAIFAIGAALWALLLVAYFAGVIL